MKKVNKEDVKTVIKATKELKLATEKMIAGAKKSGMYFLTIGLENVQNILDEYIKEYEEYLRR